jgi:site-specific DNA-methyltransferase (adenine-specific)
MSGLELNSLIKGDCFDVMKTMPDNFFDAIVTDPPYALNFMQREWDRFKGDLSGLVNYQDWTREWASEAVRILKPGASMFTFGSPRPVCRFGNHWNRGGKKS